MANDFFSSDSVLCKIFHGAFRDMQGVKTYADEIISDGCFYGEILINGDYFLAINRYGKNKCFELSYVDNNGGDSILYVYARYKSLKRAIIAANRMIAEGKRPNPIKVYN